MRLHLTSPLLQTLPVRHGFSARTGGVSEGAFASLNLGRAVGDELSAVEENHRRLADSIGYDGARLFETSQVHGATVRRIVAADESAKVRTEEADALVTNVPATAIGVRVADCLPILLADREAGVVGAVHAGWRGAAANIVPIAIDEMIALGASRTRIHVALGPHIRECCFEVGREVVDALRNVAHGAAFEVPRAAGNPHVNLASVARAQLAACGVSVARIDEVPGCTRCDATAFFSFRRDGKKSGRHLAAIAL